MNRAWVLGTTVAVAAALASPAAASANTVVDWNRYAEQAINQVAQQRGQPDLAVLDTAMVQGAVYDAVNAIARTNQPYLVAPPARRWYSEDAAAATAAYRTLTALLPEQQSTLEPLFEQSLAAIPGGAAKAGGITVGSKAAEAMLAARENDGRGEPFPIAIGTEPGEWRPTPPAFALDPAAWMANVKPFLIPSAERLRTRGPNPLTSRAYAKEFVEVKELGAASDSSRTRDQTAVALYWDRPPWWQIFRSLAQSQKLNAADTARLMAMVSLAGADATIACRNDKYHWNWWRPITAIREAASDGNPATQQDEDWTSLIDAPPYPDHPAGHTCGSGAFVGALRSFFGTDRIAFSATSSSSGATWSFTSFSQALDEVIDSRVWGGIHFRTAEVQGAQLGREVARWERRHYFEPVRPRS
jgi:CheY-like chemotaxis protein